MPGFAWLSLILASPQQPVAPYGWGCNVEEDLGSGARMDIWQSVESPGVNTFPRIVRVERNLGQIRGYTQTLQWTIRKPEDGLAEPESLSFAIDLKKRDLKGMVRLDHDGGTISLSPVRVLGEVNHRKALIRIEDGEALRTVWQSTRWRVSVLDRHGVVQTSVDGILPRREGIANAFLRLAPGLAKKVAAPDGQCSELGPEAWI